MMVESHHHLYVHARGVFAPRVIGTPLDPSSPLSLMFEMDEDESRCGPRGVPSSCVIVTPPQDPPFPPPPPPLVRFLLAFAMDRRDGFGLPPPERCSSVVGGSAAAEVAPRLRLTADARAVFALVLTSAALVLP